MNGLILHSSAESKDIKFNSKNSKDAGSKDSHGLFENLVKSLVEEENDSKNGQFLLAKLLNLPAEFEKTAKTPSDFSKDEVLDLLKSQSVTASSKEDILDDFDISLDSVTIEELFKVALNIKQTGKVELSSIDIPKDIKVKLETKSVISQLKDAKNIKDLLHVANENGIKVKNFEFFKVERALDLNDKKLVKRVTSSEIFKLIAPKYKDHTSEDHKHFLTNYKASKQNVLAKLINDTKQVSTKENSNHFEKTSTVEIKNDKKQDLKIYDEVEKLSKRVDQRSEHFDKKINKVQETLLKDEKNIASQNISKSDESKIITQGVTKKNLTTNEMISKEVVEKVLQKGAENKNNIADQRSEHQDKNINKIQEVHSKNQEKIVINELRKDEKIIKTVFEKVIQNSATKDQVESKTVEQIVSKEVKTDDNITKSILEKVNNKPLQQNQTDIEKKLIKDQVDPIKNVSKSVESKVVAENISKSVAENIVTKDHKIDENLLKTKVGDNEQISKHHKSLEQKVVKNVLNIKSQSDLASAKETNMIERDEVTLKESAEEEKSLQVNESKDIKTNTHIKTKEPVDLRKSLNTFATEFKEKVESYKAPLMKIKMQLSPQNLGDVDVTLINRGSTLHVNISSNTQSMALFMQNQAEFRNSLVNMGFSDLQMNFSQNQNGKNQQESKGKAKNSENYESFSEEDTSDSIDIVIPNYV